MDRLALSDLRINLKRGFEEMVEAERNIRSSATAATATLGPTERLNGSWSYDSNVAAVAKTTAPPAPPESQQVAVGKFDRGEHTIFCYGSEPLRESAVWSIFLADEWTRLILTYDCQVRHEDGHDWNILGSPDTASILATCRDPVSDHNHAVLYTSSGTSSTVQLLGVVPVIPAPGVEPMTLPKVLYTEAWGVMGEGKWQLDQLVSEEGTCLWRNRQEARATVKDAMVALRGVGPLREVAPATVHKWLNALESAGSAAILEAAIYADTAGRDSWRVVQVLSTTRYEWDGIVLLFDVKAGKWHALYDVSLDYPLLTMVVRGDHLFAAECVYLCYDSNAYSGQAGYDNLVIDLRTKQVAVGKISLPDSPHMRNPQVRDVSNEILW